MRVINIWAFSLTQYGSRLKASQKYRMHWRAETDTNADALNATSVMSKK